MQNLQRFLRTLREQSSKVYAACLTKHSKKLLACGMAVVVSLTALPLVDGIFSINVQAATAEDQEEAILALAASEVVEEAVEETMEVTQADSNDIMIPSLKLAADVDRELKNVDNEAAEEIYLEIFSEQDDELLDTDVLVGERTEEEELTEEKEVTEVAVEVGPIVEVKKTAEELFYEKLDYSSIPEALTVDYNPAFCMELSAEQLTVLETIVEAESGGEDIYGRMLVANVVLNRVLSNEFPDTVKEVVFQNNGKTYQFSPVRSGGRYYTVTVSETTKAAVARVLSGEDYSDGALYFFARRLTSEKKAKWFDTALDKIVEYGCHEFFGNK